MKKISFWARDHKWLARLSIVIIYLLLNIIGITTGILLHDLKIIFSTTLLPCFIGIFLTGFILYPSKVEKGKRLSPKEFYVKQKTCDFILGFSTFCLLIYIGNRPDKFFLISSIANASSVSSPASVNDSLKTYKTISSFSSSIKDKNGKLLKWKERKKLLKEQIREIKKSKGLSEGAKIALTVLSVAIALGLLYVAAALSCELSCSGSDAAALLVGIGGITLVIFFLVIAMRAIYHNGRKPHPNPQPDEG